MVERRCIMEPEDILYECFNLIWDFGEFYDSDDIDNFQHENLRTWPQHDKVNKHFEQMQQAVKTLKEIEEFCVTYSGNHDAYEAVYKQILGIISKNEVNND